MNQIIYPLRLQYINEFQEPTLLNRLWKSAKRAILIGFLLGIIYGLSACCEAPKNTEYGRVVHDESFVVTTVYVIDSCEYIQARYIGKGVSIIHKQNCRFCRERSRK
jgi:hypothetical protein